MEVITVKEEPACSYGEGASILKKEKEAVTVKKEPVWYEGAEYVYGESSIRKTGFETVSIKTEEIDIPDVDVKEENVVEDPPEDVIIAASKMVAENIFSEERSRSSKTYGERGISQKISSSCKAAKDANAYEAKKRCTRISVKRETKLICFVCGMKFGVKKSLVLHLRDNICRKVLLNCACGKDLSDPSDRVLCLKNHVNKSKKKLPYPAEKMKCLYCCRKYCYLEKHLPICPKNNREFTKSSRKNEFYSNDLLARIQEQLVQVSKINKRISRRVACNI